MDEMFGRNTLAVLLGKKPGTISTLVSQRRWDLVPKPLKFMGKYSWSKAVVQRWVEEQTFDPFGDESSEKRGRGRPSKTRQ